MVLFMYLSFGKGGGVEFICVHKYFAKLALLGSLAI
jgi:hypothetical protein